MADPVGRIAWEKLRPISLGRRGLLVGRLSALALGGKPLARVTSESAHIVALSHIDEATST